jgi:hypothetical protein
VLKQVMDKLTAHEKKFVALYLEFDSVKAQASRR